MKEFRKLVWICRAASIPKRKLRVTRQIRFDGGSGQIAGALGVERVSVLGVGRSRT
jgi:hypothetical protein